MMDFSLPKENPSQKKTLKQHLQANIFPNHLHVYELLEKDIEKAVKEWLQQKRQKLLQRDNEAIIADAIADYIKDELLEELEESED